MICKKAREEMHSHINSSAKAGIVPTYQTLLDIAISYDTPCTVPLQQSDNDFTSYPTALKSEIHPNKLDSGYGYDSECEDYYYQNDDYDDDQQDPLDEVTRVSYSNYSYSNYSSILRYSNLEYF